MCYPRPHPILVVVSSLKSYDDVNSVPTVTAFDFEAFTEKCTPYSAMYDPSFCDFDVLLRELFKSSENWASRDLLHSVVIRSSSLHGWKAQFRNHYIQCNRFGQSASHFTSNGQTNFCTFRITISVVVKYCLFHNNPHVTAPPP